MIPCGLCHSMFRRSHVWSRLISCDLSNKITKLNPLTKHRTYCDTTTDKTASPSLSIAEQNRQRALKYLSENLKQHPTKTSSEQPTAAGMNEEHSDLSRFLTDTDTDGEDLDSSKKTRQKPDAKTEAMKRIRKYIPNVTGNLPDMETIERIIQNEHGGFDIRLIDVRNKASFADWMIIVTALSDSHVVAIADGLQKDMNAAGVKVGNGRVSICGRDDGDWVVVDVGTLVVHVMTDEARQHYQIESIWNEEYNNDESLNEGI